MCSKLSAEKLTFGREEPQNTLQVFGGVDGVAFEGGHGRADAVAVFQPAELFELFGFFERRGGQAGDGSKHLAAVGVEADVFVVGVSGLPLFAGDAAQEGNDAAAEAERVARGRQDDFG